MVEKARKMGIHGDSCVILQPRWRGLTSLLTNFFIRPLSSFYWLTLLHLSVFIFSALSFSLSVCLLEGVTDGNTSTNKCHFKNKIIDQHTSLWCKLKKIEDLTSIVILPRDLFEKFYTRLVDQMATSRNVNAFLIAFGVVKKRTSRGRL